jgi:hypothetical protein
MHGRDGCRSLLRGPSSRYQIEEFAQPFLLIASQVPRFGKHTVNHARRLVPVVTDAGVQKPPPCGRPGTVRGNNVGYHRGKFIDSTQRLTSLALRAGITGALILRNPSVK